MGCICMQCLIQAHTSSTRRRGCICSAFSQAYTSSTRLLSRDQACTSCLIQACNKAATACLMRAMRACYVVIVFSHPCMQPRHCRVDLQCNGTNTCRALPTAMYMTVSSICDNATDRICVAARNRAVCTSSDGTRVHGVIMTLSP